eukprot:GEMP01008235.1.p1 GENE.GEMP01008235.1~~GEMP01008235.1.p1  ORF type:complete len:958 (+),score=224.44 GEMP01008235.1:131-3004(+)
MVFEKTLTAMVKGIRSHRGKEDEYIQSCLKEIRQEIASKNVQVKSGAVLKLAYLTVLGYDMQWAGFVVTEVMSHSRFNVKRPGYLAASMSFNDSTEVGLLTTNLFKKDFGAPTQVETGLALSCLSNIVTETIAVDLVNDLLALLASSRPYVRKKTALCLFRVFLKYPTALRACFVKLKDRLADEDQGVLTAVTNTFLELARKNPKNYLALVPQFFHLLTNTQNNWLCIKLLKLFAILCPLEPRLPGKLVEPITNMLNTTKAKSVEFEAIRFVIFIMPAKTSISSLALVKLKGFLNSSDRNLRYLAFVLIGDIIKKYDHDDILTQFPDLHDSVTEGVEEIDSMVRGAALDIMDAIVTPATFPEVVEKLRSFLKSGHGSDQFLSTLLRMGRRDQYSIIENFGWYLLILADLAKYTHSVHAEEVGRQLLDITIRVPQVRPFALSACRVLLADIETVAPDALGAVAWILGEFHQSFEESDDCPFTVSVTTLMRPYIMELSGQVQAQCVWAATKLYFGAAHHAPDSLANIAELLRAGLPQFLNSTHVDVSERATLTHHFLSFFDCDAKRLKGMSTMLDETLLPVPADAQAMLDFDPSTDIDTPFYPEKQSEVYDDKAEFEKQRDGYGLVAADYTAEDFRFCQGGADLAHQQSVPRPDSIFYLKDTKKQEKDDAKVDPLEEMKARLVAGQQQYDIIRTTAMPSRPAAPAQTAQAEAATEKDDKKVLDLLNRRWHLVLEDPQIRLYGCLKTVKRDVLRVDLRCEGDGSDVILSVENAPNVVISNGPLGEKPSKTKLQLPVAQAPARQHNVALKLSYDHNGEKKDIVGVLALPPTMGVVPLFASEEEIKDILGSGRLVAQASNSKTFPAEVHGKLGDSLRWCSALCHFFSTQQGDGNMIKSIYCAKVRSDHTPIIAMIAGTVKDDLLMVKCTVKAAAQEVADPFVEELLTVLEELLVGRLSSTPA